MDPSVLSVAAAVLDLEGRITEVNEAWRERSRCLGLRDPGFGVGRPYLEAFRSGPVEAPLAKELDDLIHGRRSTLARWYSCETPDGGRQWRFMIGVRRGDRKDVLISHLDISPLLDAGIARQIDQERPDLAFSVYAR